MANQSTPSRRHGMMAMVLGTALAALGTSSEASAAAPAKAVEGISRYCTACWRNARLPVDRWGDCTQEVFRRLLERVPLSAWSQALKGDGAERREFLRAIDAVKKRSQRERQRTVFLAADVADPHAASDLDNDRELLHRASAEILTDRQQRILRRTCEGFSTPDIAAELDTSCERVSDEKYKAIKKLQHYFRRHPEVVE